MSKPNKLKPCPFCGAASEDIETVFLGSGMTYIRCSKCMSRCGMRDGVDEAEKLWNSRGNAVESVEDLTPLAELLK